MPKFGEEIDGFGWSRPRENVSGYLLLVSSLKTDKTQFSRGTLFPFWRQNGLLIIFGDIFSKKR
jgi:hypothetical protein